MVDKKDSRRVNDVRSKIGQRIRALRESTNMVQKDLAYAADLDRSYIANSFNRCNILFSLPFSAIATSLCSGL